jgi:hypothetical protein
MRWLERTASWQCVDGGSWSYCASLCVVGFWVTLDPTEPEVHVCLVSLAGLHVWPSGYQVRWIEGKQPVVWRQLFKA